MFTQMCGSPETSSGYRKIRQGNCYLGGGNSRKLEERFASIRKLNRQFFDSQGMNGKVEDLKDLRARFDVAASKHSLSSITISRYRSWIRRYIDLCRHAGLPSKNEAVASFLKTYESFYTRRQGYYALKFLLDVVMKHPNFPTLNECSPSRRWRSERQRRWWRWARHWL